MFMQSFYVPDPKIVKRQSRHQYLFLLLGSMSAKSARKKLVKLTPGLGSYECCFISGCLRIFSLHWVIHSVVGASILPGLLKKLKSYTEHLKGGWSC